MRWAWFNVSICIRGYGSELTISCRAYLVARRNLGSSRYIAQAHAKQLASGFVD